MASPLDGSEMAVLRRFEPVVHYTRGEMFFPMDVDRYIRECSLWVQRPEEPAELLVPEGELTIARVTRPRQGGFGSVFFLKFIEPLDLIELARYSLNRVVKSFGHQNPIDVFHAGRGRLARVGYGSRFIDALFSISLLLRGRVPGDTAAAAAMTYNRLQAEDRRYVYYGRVIRENGWVILQYWFFYPFNNWRSGFFGANDHEADWEMVTLYCSEQDGHTGKDQGTGLPLVERLKPQWAAYSSHYNQGDELRRRWDDPELEKVLDEQGNEHPVVYAGAGSHASYFRPGDYLIEFELSFLSPALRLLDKLQDIWVNVLRQAGARAHKSDLYVFTVPFVDYARGDGFSIGVGQDRQWEARCVDKQTPWAVKFRGLWGLYAQDPFPGENAPGGPIYNANGTVRRSWYDPLGWAGLDKVTPPDEALDVLHRQYREVQARRAYLQKLIAEKSADLLGLGMEASAVSGYSHLEQVYYEYNGKIRLLSEELSDYRRQLTVEDAKLEVFDQQEKRLINGDLGSMREHLHHPLEPAPEVDLRLNRIAEVFAAVSIGLVMVAIVLLIVLAKDFLIFGLSAMIGLLIFVEAGFRRRLSQLISSLVIGLAVVSAFILLFEFFWQIIVSLVLGIGLYIIWDNIREIRR